MAKAHFAAMHAKPARPPARRHFFDMPDLKAAKAVLDELT
jgi:hypothetical protein